jgi:hypothetical protein
MKTLDDRFPAPRLDPEVQALVNAGMAAAKKARRERSIWEEPGKPVELRLKISSTVALCAAAGVLSACGALLLVEWPQADFSHLVITQLPAAGLIAWAFARSRKRRDSGQ